jgi:hypothetical protein
VYTRNKAKHLIPTPSHSQPYNKIKLYWVRKIPTDAQVQTSRPDTLHYDKDISDTAVSLNHNLGTENTNRINIENWLKKSSEFWEQKLIHVQLLIICLSSGLENLELN